MKRFLPLGPMLLVFGCWGAKDSALFSSTDSTSTAAAGSGGSASTGAQAGTDSSSGSSSAASGGTATNGGTGVGAGGANADPSSGGSSVAASGGVSGFGASGGNGGSGGGQVLPPPVIDSCDMLTDAVVSDLNGHCYRVNFENLTFAGARDACVAAGGHLVTISSAEENDFVHNLQHSEHWIGASDGRPDTAPGAGPYSWVNDEPWVYADWQSGQPNAFGTKCPAGEGSSCYEHCAYQTSGGDWIDRSCWHTIISVCEWDVEPAAAGGAAGAPP